MLFGWFLLSLLVGSIGNNRNIGFWGAFLLSLILSPIMGLIFTLISKSHTQMLLEKQNRDKISETLGESVKNTTKYKLLYSSWLIISILILIFLVGTFGVIKNKFFDSKIDNSYEKSIVSTTLKEQNSSKSNIFGINDDDILIRNGPGRNFDKLVNEKATEVMNTTQYKTVDNSCKVRVDETKDGWSKIVVVEPSWLTESHQGWIETKYIIKNDEQSSLNVKIRKCKILNEVSQVQSKLSSVGIGKLRNWRNDSFGWMSSTSYYSFGSTSSINGMQNNLAYYLESKSEKYIETVKLMLNINNSSEKYQAISQFDKISRKTFTSLKLKIPNGLSEAIKSEQNFTSENSEFKVSLTLNRSKIDTWKLTIEAKSL